MKKRRHAKTSRHPKKHDEEKETHKNIHVPKERRTYTYRLEIKGKEP